MHNVGAVTLCKEVKQGHWHNLLLLQYPHEVSELLCSYNTREIPKLCLVKSLPKYSTCKNPFQTAPVPNVLSFSPFSLLSFLLLLKLHYPQLLSKRDCMAGALRQARTMTWEARKSLMAWSLNIAWCCSVSLAAAIHPLQVLQNMAEAVAYI